MIRGTVKRIIRKSGYIQRCSECGRVVNNGHCVVHVDANLEDDLRVKAGLGEKNSIAVINDGVAEELLETTIDEAKEQTDKQIEDIMADKVKGQKFEFQGKLLGENFIVEDFQRQ